MLPITTCVLDTGTMGMAGRPAFRRNADSPEDEKMNNTRACDNTTTRADSDDSSMMLFPTCSITLRE